MWHFPKHFWICALFKQLQCYRHNSDPKFGRLWKLIYTFDLLNDVHAKFYSVAGRLTVGKVTEVLKRRIIFKRCMPKKHKVFRKKFTHCVTWVGEYINGCALRKGQDNCNCTIDSCHSYCTQNWKNMDRNFVLTIFCVQLIQQYDKNGKRRVVVGQWDLKEK